MAVQGLGYNPYGFGGYYNSSTMSDDFLANQYFGHKYSVNPDLLGGTNNNQPKVDSFEKQGSSNTGKGLLLGAGAGIGTGLAVNQWYTNPVGEKELSKGFTKQFSKEYGEIVRKNATENVFKNHNGLTSEIMKELDDFAFNGDASKLSKSAKKYLTKEGLAADQTAVENWIKSVNNEVSAIVDPKDISLQTEKLQKLETAKTGLKGLTDSKKATLEKFLTENADHFGLKGADEAATKTNIQNFLNKNRLGALDPTTQANLTNKYAAKAKELGLEGKTTAETATNVRNYINEKLAKAEMTRNINGKIKTQKTATKNATQVLDEVFGLWNKDRKAFKAGSTKEITEACKNSLSKFKWKTAGKFGAIAAGVVALGVWMFGGSSNTAKA